MQKEQLIQELRIILDKLDCDSDSLITRVKSVKHNNEIEVLIQHIRILIEDLKHDNVSLRNEVFRLREILENGDGYMEQGL